MKERLQIEGRSRRIEFSLRHLDFEVPEGYSNILQTVGYEFEIHSRGQAEREREISRGH